MTATVPAPAPHQGHQGQHAASLLDPVVPAGTTPTTRYDEGPIRAAAIRIVAGYVILTLAMFATGWLLTRPLDNSVGAWDQRVNEWFAARRGGVWDGVTNVATLALNTEPVVIVAAVIVGLLAWRRRWREAAFLTVALFVEITVFLSVTFLVDRPRPAVVRMNSTPSTSSFPSGHTAAATVLFAGLVVIATCCSPSRALRRLAVLVAAIAAPLVGFARVYRGLHHPTDVVVAMMFGLGCLVVAAVAVRAASVAVDRRHAHAASP